MGEPTAIGDTVKAGKRAWWPYVVTAILAAWTWRLSEELDAVRSKADFAEAKALSALSRVADLESQMERLR